MTEISKIDLLKIDARLQARKENKAASTDSGFEDQLLKTVKELETIGSEIDAMMESSSINVSSALPVSQITNREVQPNTESIVENFSTTKKTAKSAKSVAAEYQSMNTLKKS